MMLNKRLQDMKIYAIKICEAYDDPILRSIEAATDGRRSAKVSRTKTT